MIINETILGEDYQLEKAINESIIRSLNVEDMYLVEGISVDQFKKTVRLTDTPDGVDFSNKKYIHYRYRLDNRPVDVISIFKRTPYTNSYDKTDIDGNPFIYALKGTDGWSFDITDEEITHYVRRFLEICNSIDKRYDTIIIVPSSHDINRRFMKVIASRVKASDTIEDMFLKSTKSNALASLDVKAIEKYCEEKYPRTTDYMFNSITNEIKRAFNRMTGKYFEAKKMPKEYLKFIKEPVTVNNGFSVNAATQLINGKSVLVLDDTLSTGATISACVRVINQYEPKRLDVITLLSKKFKK